MEDGGARDGGGGGGGGGGGAFILSYGVSKNVRPSEKILATPLFICSFLLSHIVLWSFKGIFVRANKTSICSDVVAENQVIENCREQNHEFSR